jgi:lipopolysaccharide export system permease protein
MVIYVDRMKSLDDMEGIFISDERSAKEPYAIAAKRGALTADQRTMDVTLALRDGAIHTLPREEQSYTQMGFDAARLHLDISSALVQKGAPGRGFEDMNSRELLREIRRARREGKPTTPLEAEFHKRLSIPFACLILGLVGAPLGIRRGRSGKSAGIAVAFLVFLVYYMILGTAANLAETGALPPLPAYWIPNAFMAMAAGLFVIKKGQETDLMIVHGISRFYYSLKSRTGKLR